MGPLLDKAGPKITSLVATVCVAIGAIIFAFSSEGNILCSFLFSLFLEFQGYIPGIIFIGAGGPGMDISLLHLSNLFPGKESSIVSIFSGTWGASSFVFYIFLVRIINNGNLFLTIKGN